MELEKLLNKHRSDDGGFDCITTVSGGKDGSYVSYMLKHKYNMNPLAITVRPALATGIGDQNLYNFMGDGLSNARNKIIKNGDNIANWNVHKRDI